MRELSYTKAVHTDKLDKELRAAVGYFQTGGKYDSISTLPNSGLIVRVVDETTEGDETTIGNVVTAHDPTPPPTPLQAYANAFLANKAIIFNAFMTYDKACRESDDPPTLAQKRALLGSTLTILNTLPQAFKDRVDRWQSRKGLPRAPGVPVNTWTALQCDGWMDLLDSWFGEALGGIAAAMAGSLDNGS